MVCYKVKKGLVGNNPEARKGWAALDESKRQKYVKKANKNTEKRRAILKEYKKTEKYKQWHKEFEQWKRSVEKHYPPRPKLKHAVECLHFCQFPVPMFYEFAI